MYKQLIALSNIFKDGFTVSVDKGIITQFNANTGYIVSFKTVIKVKDGKIVIKGKILDKAIIGGYWDKESNTCLIELNTVYSDLDKAMKEGIVLNQYSVWDIKRNKEVVL